MVRDKKISAGFTVAVLLWAAAMGVWGLGWLLDSAPIRVLSVIVCIGGATATVRNYFVHQNQMVRDMFEMGRDSVSAVTRMHR